MKWLKGSCCFNLITIKCLFLQRWRVCHRSDRKDAPGQFKLASLPLSRLYLVTSEKKTLHISSVSSDVFVITLNWNLWAQSFGGCFHEFDLFSWKMLTLTSVLLCFWCLWVKSKTAEVSLSRLDATSTHPSIFWKCSSCARSLGARPS